MNITIGKPCAVSEKGGRLNNEDSIYPQPESINSHQSLFLVCDGVGGSERGEIASALACEAFQTYFTTFLSDDPSPDFIQKAIRYTESRFDDYVHHNPFAKGMATTLAMVYLGHNGVTLAHVGDSRIYLFRKGQIVYRTEDHSLINSWIKLGKVTKEEARQHPQKHVILRAIQGFEQNVDIEIDLLANIQNGDYLFMCTDGVQEQVTDEQLSAIFKCGQHPETIKNEIMSYCSGRTHDNYSFYIIPIQNVSVQASLKQNILSLLYSFI